MGDVLAAPILARYQAPKEVVKESVRCVSAMELLDWLVLEKRFQQAIDFVAHWMTSEQAIWWGCLAIWEVDRQRGNPKIEQAMGSVVQWLNDRKEERRRLLAKIHEQLGPKEPVAMLCMAAFFSEGSISGPDLPPVTAPKFTYAIIVAGTVNVIAAKAPPIQHSGRCKQLLRLAMEVLQNVNHWKKVA